jgi:deoxyribonuclease I
MRHVTKAFFLAAILCLPIAAPTQAITGKDQRAPVVQSQPARNGPIIGDKSSKRYHRSDCPGYSKVSDRNRVYFRSAAEAEKEGYKLAGNCPRRVK